MAQAKNYTDQRTLTTSKRFLKENGRSTFPPLAKFVLVLLQHMFVTLFYSFSPPVQGSSPMAATGGLCEQQRREPVSHSLSAAGESDTLTVCFLCIYRIVHLCNNYLGFKII